MSHAKLQVWVLAASTGGIAAVSRFLSLVPRLDQVAFFYVQHLVEEQHRHLIRIVRRHCDWQVTGVDYGSPLRGGRVVVPSADERFDIGDDGLIGVTEREGWKPPYRPNIDDVAVQIGRFYGAASGIIVFTGMGRDGARGSAEIQRCGGRVWVQTPETCDAVSMPQAAMAATNPHLCGGVEDLAENFKRMFAPE